MMTLDDAIKKHMKLAEEQKAKAKLFENNPFYGSTADKLKEDAEENAQIAEWLIQLKELKEAYESDYRVDDMIQAAVSIWG